MFWICLLLVFLFLKQPVIVSKNNVHLGKLQDRHFFKNYLYQGEGNRTKVLIRFVWAIHEDQYLKRKIFWRKYKIAINKTSGLKSSRKRRLLRFTAYMLCRSWIIFNSITKSAKYDDVPICRRRTSFTPEWKQRKISPHTKVVSLNFWPPNNLDPIFFWFWQNYYLLYWSRGWGKTA